MNFLIFFIKLLTLLINRTTNRYVPDPTKIIAKICPLKEKKKNCSQLINKTNNWFKGFFFNFFFSVLSGKRTSNCPHRELAKFGYSSERKVESFCIYWRYVLAFGLNMAAFFSPKKSFWTCCSTFF